MGSPERGKQIAFRLAAHAWMGRRRVEPGEVGIETELRRNPRRGGTGVAARAEQPIEPVGNLFSTLHQEPQVLLQVGAITGMSFRKAASILGGRAQALDAGPRFARAAVQIRHKSFEHRPVLPKYTDGALQPHRVEKGRREETDESHIKKQLRRVHRTTILAAFR